MFSGRSDPGLAEVKGQKGLLSTGEGTQTDPYGPVVPSGRSPGGSQQRWLHSGPEVESWLSHSVNVALSVSISKVTLLVVNLDRPVTASAERAELVDTRFFAQIAPLLVWKRD